MTKEECMAKVDEMVEGLKKDLRAEAERLFDTDAIATETYGNNFQLPKVLLTAALFNLRYLKAVITPASKEAVEALTKV